MQKFGLNHQILSSWLHSISYVRNLCAHHSRLWNHQMTIKPTVPSDRRIISTAIKTNAFMHRFLRCKFCFREYGQTTIGQNNYAPW